MPHGNVDGSAKPEATPHTNAFVRKASEAARALATLAPLVYFVPGALDPLGLYEADARLPPGQPRNAHNMVEKVTSALWVAGWGGATMPFERDAHGKRRAANESTAHPWDGGWTQFPFDEREAQRRQQPWWDYPRAGDAAADGDGDGRRQQRLTSTRRRARGVAKRIRAARMKCLSSERGGRGGVAFRHA